MIWSSRTASWAWKLEDPGRGRGLGLTRVLAGFAPWGVICRLGPWLPSGAYNGHRPHRALGLKPPDRSVEAPTAVPPLDVRREDMLGGLIHEYRIAA